jgi:hypothetical protein
MNISILHTVVLIYSVQESSTQVERVFATLPYPPIPECEVIALLYYYWVLVALLALVFFGLLTRKIGRCAPAPPPPSGQQLKCMYILFI